MFICCCHPNLEHNECLKFKLMFSNMNETGQFSLYNRHEHLPGTLTDLTPYEIGHSKFSGKKIFGRNKDMHKMYRDLCTLKNIRIIQLCGESGIGKTTLAKQVANYVYERKHFKRKIVYESFINITSITTFMTKINDENCSLEKLCQIYKYDEVLYILDDCDQLIDQNLKNIQQKLRQIIQNTTHVKFMIITQDMKKLELHETNINVSPLQKIDAAKILIQTGADKLPKRYLDPYELADHKIFDQFVLSPALVLAAAQRLEVYKDINRLCD